MVLPQSELTMELLSFRVLPTFFSLLALHQRQVPPGERRAAEGPEDKIGGNGLIENQAGAVAVFRHEADLGDLVALVGA